jgi:hypothetical protein
MIMSLLAPLLALALVESTASASCSADASGLGVYPPPGCVEMVYQGTCYLQCDTSPFIRRCEPDQ